MPYVEYDEVQAVCPDCGRPFRSEEALDQHREEVHAPSAETVPGPTSPGPPFCPACRLPFATSQDLDHHRRSAHRPGTRR
ncbi:MAG: C2H2-type zinc finger protein [Thermoplasmata archaeon]